MSDIVVEQLGGFVGGGTSMGPLRMEGRVAWSALSEADRATVEALFAQPAQPHTNMRYRLTRDGPNGQQQVVVPMEAVPQALIASVKTTIK